MGCKRGTRKSSNSKREGKGGGGGRRKRRVKEEVKWLGLKEGMDEHGVKR